VNPTDKFIEVVCPMCGGKVSNDPTKIICFRCNGTGKILVKENA
jgi:DnaJ-class molecular chaperone